VDFSLSDEQAAIVDAVRAFIDREVRPYEPLVLQRAAQGGPEGLAADELAELRAKAKASGLWGMSTPTEFGGAGLDITTQTLINLQLGRTFLHFTFGGDTFPPLFALDQQQREQYLFPALAGHRIPCFALSEPAGGSDARAIRTTAVRDGDEWVINGEKLWISNGDVADFAIVFARTPGEGDEKGISVFLVDRDMGWKSSPFPLMGSWTVAALSFQGVRVPVPNLVGEVNRGFETIGLSTLFPTRVQLAAWALGNAERLLEMAVEWAENRVTFGEPLSQRENIRWMIADGDVAVRAGKLLCLHAASLFDRGLDARHAANAAKVFSAQEACRIADDVLQIHGAMGYAKELPIERFYRDLRVARIYEGTDEMMRLAISRDLFQRHTRVGEID
jgi:acyl-CoA dehydrogenase